VWATWRARSLTPVIGRPVARLLPGVSKKEAIRIRLEDISTHRLREKHRIDTKIGWLHILKGHGTWRLLRFKRSAQKWGWAKNILTLYRRVWRINFLKEIPQVFLLSSWTLSGYRSSPASRHLLRFLIAVRKPNPESRVWDLEGCRRQWPVKQTAKLEILKASTKRFTGVEGWLFLSI